MIVKCLNDSNTMCQGGALLCQNHSYTVYGIGIRRIESFMARHASTMTFLIEAEDGTPRFFDAARFAVIDRGMPACWEFGHADAFSPESNSITLDVEGAAYAVIGYPELASGHAHYVGIELQNPQDLGIFRRRQVEIDAASPRAMVT